MKGGSGIAYKIPRPGTSRNRYAARMAYNSYQDLIILFYCGKAEKIFIYYLKLSLFFYLFIIVIIYVLVIYIV